MFKKIVIWGHKYHSHTHSYIHAGYFRAFQYLGYDVLWLDNNDKVEDYNFDNCLFITEGNVEKKIPIVNNSKYVVAYADRNNKILHRYFENNLITLSSRQYDELDIHVSHDRAAQKMDNFSYLRNNSSSNVSNDDRWYKSSKYTLFQPWATDLLPNEIIKIKRFNQSSLKNIYHIGTIHTGFDNYIQGYIQEIIKNKKRFIVKNSSKKNLILKILNKIYQNNNIDSKFIKKDIKKNIKFISHSYVNASLQPDIQVDGKKKGYIPCRILKNLSYGRLCGTNSKYVNAIFDNILPFSSSSSELYYRIEESEHNITNQSIDFIFHQVKSNHTYINRAKNILRAF